MIGLLQGALAHLAHILHVPTNLAEKLLAYGAFAVK